MTGEAIKSGGQGLRRGQRLFGRFTLVRELGRGKHAAVWLADDRELAERVALKVFAQPVNAAAREQLARETGIGATLQHPHIRRVHDLYEDADFLALAQAYVAGTTLESYKGKHYRLFIPELRHLVDALGYAHGRGVIHRDLKLSNVLLGEDGRLRLADFGVAAALATGGNTFGGGSPYSMSPQQHQGAAAATADDLYGLGTLLYELLDGEPPFAGELDAEKLLGVEPPPPRLQHDIPPALLKLVAALLAKDPQSRPSLAEVDATFAQLLAAEANATLPPDSVPAPREEAAGFEPIVPVALPEQVQVAADTGANAPRATMPLRTAALVFGLLLAVLGAAIYFLQGLSGRVEPLATEIDVTPAEIDETALPEPDEPFRLAQLARERELAEQALTKLLDRQLRLETRDVANWGQQELEAAKQLAVQGDGFFKRLKYQRANDLYLDALAAVDALHARADDMVATAIAAGNAALEVGDDTLAVTEFEKALVIDPKDTHALAGKEKAGRVRKVDALLATAREQERANKLSAARKTYQEVLGLEPSDSRAKTALAKLDRARAQDRFRQTMSRGFAALAANDSDAARSAFEEAGRLRPGAAEVTEGLRQLDQAAESEAVAAMRARADAFESAGDWQQAADAFGSILARDPSLVFAQEGQQRNRERATLVRELDGFVSQPEQLARDSSYDQAQSLVGRLDSRGDLSANDRVKTAELKRILAVARTPVRVQLASDNLTEVNVYRVDRLGRFETFELELVPGRYTAVGTRRGYRDVRREFTIVAGQPPPLIDVRCVKRI